MKLRTVFVPLAALLCTGANFSPGLLAQAVDATQAPKILMITREMLKPGKDGAAHEKTEAAYLRAMSANKGTVHYIGLTSLTGEPRALFMSGYPSFEAIEQERKGMSSVLQTALDQAGEADGELLNNISSSIFVRRDDISLNDDNIRPGTRYLEIEQLMVKPGHGMQFEQLAKMVTEGFKKAVPEDHWTAYQMMFGAGPASPDSIYLIITAHKSMAEIDSDMLSDKRLVEAMGEDGMKKIGELEADCLVGQLRNVFAISPKMSAPPEGLAKGEPDFWKVKAAGPVTASTKKPAQTNVASERKPAGQ